MIKTFLKFEAIDSALYVYTVMLFIFFFCFVRHYTMLQFLLCEGFLHVRVIHVHPNQLKMIVNLLQLSLIHI